LIVRIERTAHNLSRSPAKGHRLRHDRPATDIRVFGGS
jgi:hypothetical protein